LPSFDLLPFSSLLSFSFYSGYARYLGLHASGIISTASVSTFLFSFFLPLLLISWFTDPLRFGVEESKAEFGQDNDHVHDLKDKEEKQR